MDNFRKDEIVYEEGWQSFDDSQRYDDIELNAECAECDDVSEDMKPSDKRKKRSMVSLITIQLVISLIIAFLVFMLKAVNGDMYKKLSTWYNCAMRDTLVSDKTFEDIDLSHYKESTVDQALSTKDES